MKTPMEILSEKWRGATNTENFFIAIKAMEKYAEQQVRNLNIPAVSNRREQLIAGVALKWKYYRDTHYKLYEVTLDVEGYQKSISWYQKVLKGWMQKHNQQIIEAITEICKQEDDAITKIKFICAGYDLAGGQDYACS